jgi:hypothetical protein
MVATWLPQSNEQVKISKNKKLPMQRISEFATLAVLFFVTVSTANL